MSSHSNMISSIAHNMREDQSINDGDPLIHIRIESFVQCCLPWLKQHYSDAMIIQKELNNHYYFRTNFRIVDTNVPIKYGLIFDYFNLIGIYILIP